MYEVAGAQENAIQSHKKLCRDRKEMKGMSDLTANVCRAGKLIRIQNNRILQCRLI
jgi:hypothetical protein